MSVSDGDGGVDTDDTDDTVDADDAVQPARLRDLRREHGSDEVPERRFRRRDRRSNPDFQRRRDLTPSPPLERHRDPAVPPELVERDREALEHRDDTPVAELRRRRSRRWQRVLLAGAVVFALLVGYYLVSLFQVFATGRGDQARPTDAIVVLGAAQYDGRPSPQLAARLDHVAQLWPQGLAPLVVVTGGNQPGDRFTEAEASANYLIERGVPESAIVLEDRGSSSYDSLARVAEMLNSRGSGGGDGGGGGDGDGDDVSVLVVTDPYHSLRSRLIAQEVGLTAYTSPTDTSVVTGARSLERHVWEAGGVAIGRVTSFGWLDRLTD